MRDSHLFSLECIRSKGLLRKHISIKYSILGILLPPSDLVLFINDKNRVDKHVLIMLLYYNVKQFGITRI